MTAYEHGKVKRFADFLSKKEEEFLVPWQNISTKTEATTFSFKEFETQVTWCTYPERLGWLPLRNYSAFLGEVTLALTKLSV